MKYLLIFIPMFFVVAELESATTESNKKPKRTFPFFSTPKVPKEQKCDILAASPVSKFSTQFSLLYWGCAERGLDYAVTRSLSSSRAEMQIEQPNFEWSPAFRLFLGFGLPRGGWEVDCSYSFFLNSSKRKVSTQALSVWTSPAAFSGTNSHVLWQHASARWKIFANFIDLFLSEEFHNSPALAFYPSFGLRGALFYQNYDLSYRNSQQSSKIKMRNDSFHLGPSFTLATDWSFTPNWSLAGSLTAAVLASNFDVSRHETDVDSVQKEIYPFEEKFVSCRPQGGGRLGVLWKSCSKAISYQVAASYEAQIWWKQNMFLRHIDSVNFQGYNVEPVQGDLFFQGLTVDLRLVY